MNEINKVSEIDLRTMSLHEKIVLNRFVWVMKVPTGWIYYHQNHSDSDLVTSTFVPERI